MSTKKVPFSNLAWQFSQIKQIEDEVINVLNSGNYVSGVNVNKFEVDFAKFSNQTFAIGVNSGTSALHACLIALGVKRGDEVIVPSHTFIASINAIILAGAVPVLVDVNKHGLVEYDNIEKGLSDLTKAIMPVHLYGSCVDSKSMYSILKLNKKIVEDASQAHGAKFENNQDPGFYSDTVAYSLYPGKNLGAAGEAGVVTTNSEQIASDLKLIRNWGAPKKYLHETFGLNLRMDEIQAVILNAKLTHLDDWNAQRIDIAKRYIEGLEGVEIVNKLSGKPVFHQFVIKVNRRDLLAQHLNEKGIETMVHYPIANHLQNSLRGKVRIAEKLNETESLTSNILSLPIYPGMTSEQVEHVIENVNVFQARN